MFNSKLKMEKSEKSDGQKEIAQNSDCGKET